ARGARPVGAPMGRARGVPVSSWGGPAGARRRAAVGAGRGPPARGRAPHPPAGAVCGGARQVLVAFNVAFSGLPLVRARRIASLMRELPGVQALAFQLSGGLAQISMNLARPNETSVAEAYKRACDLAGLPGEPH